MADSTLEQKHVAAWIACQNPDLDSDNPHFRSKYASLKATLGVVREACKAQGIAYFQIIAPVDENRLELRSYVTDGSGERAEVSRFPLIASANPQTFGSSLTYTKRQQAQSDWGITGEPDDDGEAAVGRGKPKLAPKQPKADVAEKRKKMLARCAKLSAQCIENGMNAGATEGYMTAKYKVESMSELTDEQLIEYGTYLRQMEEQSRRFKEEQ